MPAATITSTIRFRRKDYYGLYGVFASSQEPKELPLLGEPAQTPEYLAFQKKLEDLEADVQNYTTKNKKELAEKNRKFRDALRALQKKVDAFKASSPCRPAARHGAGRSARTRDARVFLRGNPGSPGPGRRGSS